MVMLSRRALLAGAAGLAGTAPLRPFKAFAAGQIKDEVGSPLAPWQPGLLDIHHIATGRGDATLVVAPDGTTLLIDAGAVAKPEPGLVPARPSEDRRAGEWIARYVRRRLAETGRDALDTLYVTHLHPDHIGGVGEGVPFAPGDAYQLTGVADVAAALPVRRIIDPDFPDYGYPAFEDAAASENYIAFISDWSARGGHVERFRPGAADQFRLEHGTSATPFEIRNLAAKGVVWTGFGEDTVARFPSRDQLAAGEHPNVNACSAAIRLRFGDFSYFQGGDITDWADGGAKPWMDALTPAARAAGPVDVAVVPHHGMYDAAGESMVRALAAKVWVVSAWHAAHPSIPTLERLFNERLYPGARSVYATSLHPAAELSMPWLSRRLASRDGHVVIRVAADGRSFRTVVTRHDDETDRVVLATAAMQARGSGAVLRP